MDRIAPLEQSHRQLCTRVDNNHSQNLTPARPKASSVIYTQSELGSQPRLLASTSATTTCSGHTDTEQEKCKWLLYNNLKRGDAHAKSEIHPYQQGTPQEKVRMCHQTAHIQRIDERRLTTTSCYCKELKYLENPTSTSVHLTAISILKSFWQCILTVATKERRTVY